MYASKYVCMYICTHVMCQATPPTEGVANALGVLVELLAGESKTSTRTYWLYIFLSGLIGLYARLKLLMP